MRLKPVREDKISCDGTQVIELRNSKGASQESQGVTAAFQPLTPQMTSCAATLSRPSCTATPQRLATVTIQTNASLPHCENIFPGPEIKEHDSNRTKYNTRRSFSETPRLTFNLSNRITAYFLVGALTSCVVLIFQEFFFFFFRKEINKLYFWRDTTQPLAPVMRVTESWLKHQDIQPEHPNRFLL